jgi:hypothetical protein
MMGADDGSSEIPPITNQNHGYRLARTPCQSPAKKVKWVNVRSKQSS